MSHGFHVEITYEHVHQPALNSKVPTDEIFTQEEPQKHNPAMDNFVSLEPKCNFSVNRVKKQKERK